MSTWPAESCGTYKGDVLVPSGKDQYFLYNAAIGGAQKGLTHLNATYVEPRETPETKARMLLTVPTGLPKWLGTQEHVAEQFPYVANCWAWNGDGQPT